MSRKYNEHNFPYCPADDWDCPYYDGKSMRCKMFEEEGVTPYKECDAFYDYESEEEEDE
jgi:hypothetical protein